MLQKGISEIAADVKVCIDQIGLNESEFLICEDNADMDTIIESKVVDALRYVNVNADMELLEPTFEEKEGAKTPLREGDALSVIAVALDDAFLRLCYAKMPDWNTAVTKVILSTEKEYASLKNPITTGYPDNPKVALTRTTGGEKTLELYRSAEGTATIGYIKEAEMEDGRYAIADKVYRGFIYYVAALTLLTYKDPHADALFNQAMVMLGVQPKQ